MDPNSARSQGAEFLDAIREPVFAGITYQYDESVFYDVMPDKTGDIFSSKPIYIVAKYKAPLQGSFIISGNSAKGPVKIPISLENVKADDSNQAVRYLWAREAIAVFSDQEVYARQSRKDEITALGLQYGLLTNYTSFVAIDQYVRNVSGEAETVKQPLPMPRHVSNRAIGGGSASPLYSFRLSQPNDHSFLRDSHGEVIDKAYVEGNLFFIRDDVWVDARHDPSIILINVTKDSEALKSLIARFPWAELLLELGVKFIVSDGKDSFAYGV